MSSSDVPSQQKLSVLTNPMASFDTNARIFVQLSKDNRMKVWNPETNVLQQDLTLPFQLSAKYTCLALSPLDEKEDHSAQYLACGTADGTVIVWDLKKGEIHAELGKSTTQENKGTPIDALAFVNKNTLYAASRKVTTLWDIKTSNKMQTFNFVKRSSAMCSDAEGTLLAVASADSGTRINVYLQQPGKQSTKPALKINAHTAPANQLITFSLPKVENGLRMLSISNDRYINYYNLNLEDKETDPIKVFACEERPIRIDVVPKKKGFDLLCLTEAGNIFIYKVHESEKKGIEIKSTIKVCNAKATKSQKILSAVFDKSSKKYEIIIARGLSTRPHFEKISYKGKADTITLEELDENFLLSNKTVQQDARMEDFENDKETLDSSLANNSSSKIPNMAKTSTNNKAKVINKQQTEHTRKSLQAIIDESEIQDKQVRPRTQVALTSAVSQALTSGDSEMLQNCLEESDTTLINDTVAGLPAGQIMGLILSIAKRFEAAGHPRTVAVLLRWINAILRTHTTYLMTHPNAMKTLSPLHSTIHSRVANYNKLASLAGKLELVISQFGDRVQQDTTALNYYREGESATDDIIARYDATKEDEDEADGQHDANGLLLDTDGDFDMGGDDIEMHMGDSDDEEDDTEEYILE